MMEIDAIERKTGVMLSGMDREEARELACIIWDWQAAQGDED